MEKDNTSELVRIIHPTHVEEWWPKVEKWLEKAIPKDVELFTISDVKDKCQSGDWILIACEHGAAVVYFEDYPKGKALHILLMGGKNGKKWLDEMFMLIETIAGATDCKYVMACGRKGWEKKRPDYMPSSVWYVKGLSSE